MTEILKLINAGTKLPMRIDHNSPEDCGVCDWCGKNLMDEWNFFSIIKTVGLLRYHPQCFKDNSDEILATSHFENQLKMTEIIDGDV